MHRLEVPFSHNSLYLCWSAYQAIEVYRLRLVRVCGGRSSFFRFVVECPSGLSAEGDALASPMAIGDIAVIVSFGCCFYLLEREAFGIEYLGNLGIDVRGEPQGVAGRDVGDIHTQAEQISDELPYRTPCLPSSSGRQV